MTRHDAGDASFGDHEGTFNVGHSDATIGLVKVESSTGIEYALQAVGTVQFIGIEGV